MLSFFSLAISLSLDAIGVGMVYGMKKIRIALSSCIFMSLVIFLCSASSVILGNILYCVLPEKLGGWISVLLLFSMGIYMLYRTYKDQSHDLADLRAKAQKKGARHPLATSLTVIQDPLQSDLNASQSIEPYEAIWIGLALSLDSIGAGIGYSMGTASLLFFPLFICLFQWFFLFLGFLCGRHWIKLPLSKTFLSILPGIIMIFLALLRLCRG